MKNQKLSDEELKTIFNNMRIFRNMLGIKQEAFADSIGMKQGDYSKLESGKKDNWSKYWDIIASTLCVHPLQLTLRNCQIENRNGMLVINGLDTSQYEFLEPNIRLWKILDEKREREFNALKDENNVLKQSLKLKENKILKAYKIIAHQNKMLQKFAVNIS